LTLFYDHVICDVKLVFMVVLATFIMTVGSSVCYVLPYVESPSLYGYMI